MKNREHPSVAAYRRATPPPPPRPGRVRRAASRRRRPHRRRSPRGSAALEASVDGCTVASYRHRRQPEGRRHTPSLRDHIGRGGAGGSATPEGSVGGSATRCRHRNRSLGWRIRPSRGRRRRIHHPCRPLSPVAAP